MARGASPGKSIVLLAGAVALACVAALVLFGRPSAPPPSAPAAPAPAADDVAADDFAADLPVAQPMAPAAPPSPAPPEEGFAAEPATPPEAPAEPERGDESLPDVASGIGLFPPPGTDPIKVGIVVPEDFELPEGYLRHYQVTDDGQDLEPILLFHPDYELLDDAGNPIPLPPDRVVPPELAPPGLPIRMVEIPEPLADDAP